jgi:Protein of unknown function (DUF3826)
MKLLTKTFLIGLLSTAALVLPAAAQTTKPAKAAKAKPATTKPVEDPAEFAKAAAARAESLINGLNIDDAAKADRAKAALTAFLVDIHQWHVANDDRIKQLSKDPAGADELEKIQAERRAIHNADMAKLSAELTPDQLEKVKEKLTGGQMMATVKNYPVIVKNITPEESAMILKTLQEAREEAMDSGSKNERVAIFKKYKGKINNELDAHGHTVAQDYKDWGAAQKAAKQSGAATKPADEGADAN